MRRASRPLVHHTRWALAIVALALATGAQAQEPADAAAEQYAAPAPSSLPPPLDPSRTGALPQLPGRKQFYITPGFSFPLNSDDSASEDNDRSGAHPVGFVDMRYSPRENWFAGVTLYGYPDGREDWQPDFSYAFGYDDWRPNTWSLVYANYTNNRFNPDDGEDVTSLDKGTLSAGYKFRLPEAVRVPSADIGDEGRVNCRVGYHYTARYETDAGPDRSNKQAASVGCRAPIWKRLYFDLTAYDYVTGEQQPWDPDFTYAFGWFDWRPNHFSIQYTNYSGTRFPWRDGTSRTARFNDGAISVTYNLAF